MQSQQKLIRGAFVRMMIVNMFVMMASCLTGFIDNIIVGSYLGTEALAAVGYFSPVATAVGVYNTIVLGAQVLCGNYIGAGKSGSSSCCLSASLSFSALSPPALPSSALRFAKALPRF